MPDVSADPEVIRRESRRWLDLAERMTQTRRDTSDLWLGILAFFPGGMTEAHHHAKYQDLYRAVVHRLEGAAVEFELIGTTLRNIASDYENDERVTADSFRVTDAELERATDIHTPPPAIGAHDSTPV